MGEYKEEWYNVVIYNHCVSRQIVVPYSKKLSSEKTFKDLRLFTTVFREIIWGRGIFWHQQWAICKSHKNLFPTVCESFLLWKFPLTVIKLKWRRKQAGGAWVALQSKSIGTVPFMREERIKELCQCIISYHLPVPYSKHFNVVLVLVVTTAACYNGASFYIDVFSQRYHFERVLKSGSSNSTKNDWFY